MESSPPSAAWYPATLLFNSIQLSKAISWKSSIVTKYCHWLSSRGFHLAWVGYVRSTEWTSTHSINARSTLIVKHLFHRFWLSLLALTWALNLCNSFHYQTIIFVFSQSFMFMSSCQLSSTKKCSLLLVKENYTHVHSKLFAPIQICIQRVFPVLC